MAEQFLHRANCTLSRRHSMILMPVPYNRLAISPCVPVSRDKIACISPRIDTNGKNAG
jgi:hypothetical protein